MKTLYVIISSMLLFACASTRHEVLNERGELVYENGKLISSIEYGDLQKAKLARILQGNAIYLDNSGVDIAGGPRVASTSVINGKDLVVSNGGSNTGTLQDLIPTAASAAIYGGAAVGAQALANSANETIARTMANSNVQAAQAYAKGNIQAAAALRPAVTNISNSQGQFQAQKQKSFSEGSTALSVSEGGNAFAKGGTANSFSVSDADARAGALSISASRASASANPVVKTGIGIDVDVSNKSTNLNANFNSNSNEIDVAPGDGGCQGNCGDNNHDK